MKDVVEGRVPRARRENEIRVGKVIDGNKVKV